MDKIPYWNGTPNGPALFDTNYLHYAGVRSQSDGRWTEHRETAAATGTDLSLRTTRDDATFWVRTKG